MRSTLLLVCVFVMAIIPVQMLNRMYPLSSIGMRDTPTKSLVRTQMVMSLLKSQEMVQLFSLILRFKIFQEGIKITVSISA